MKMSDVKWELWNMNTTPAYSLSGLKAWARLLDVHDGDTIRVAVEVFPGKVMQSLVRIAGINAPELSDTEAGQNARVRLLQLLVPDCTFGMTPSKKELQLYLHERVCLVVIDCAGIDKYGRVLARVARDPSAPDVGDVLLQEHLARPYTCK